MIICVFMLLPFIAGATDGPKEQARVTIDKTLAILKDRDLKKPSRAKERRALIRKEISSIFDFTEMSRQALGVHWSQRTEAEKKEFTALFSDLLEKTYIGKIEGYSNEKIFYDEQTIDGNYATLKTRIVTAKNVTVPVVYRFLYKDQRWVVYDVVIEGVSLVGNYRTQFNRIIRQESYKGLVKKIKNKSLDNGRGAKG